MEFITPVRGDDDRPSIIGAQHVCTVSVQLPENIGTRMAVAIARAHTHEGDPRTGYVEQCPRGARGAPVMADLENVGAQVAA
jgi:hypothetical protein